MSTVRTALIPPDDGAARPQSRRLPDQRMCDAVGQRVPPPGWTRLEHRPSHVPLQEVHRPARRRREMRDLMCEQALAGPGQSRHEHHAVEAERSKLLRKSRLAAHDDAVAAVAVSARRHLYTSTALPITLR